MREVKAIKWLVQATALAIFVAQMIFAIQKYTSEPTVISVGSKPYTNLGRKIQITMCKTGQYLYENSNKLGYELKEDYVGGVIANSSILSWRGLNGNITLNETLSYLFNSEVEHVSFKGIDNVETKFLLPFGICSLATVLPTQITNRHVHLGS